MRTSVIVFSALVLAAVQSQAEVKSPDTNQPRSDISGPSENLGASSKSSGSSSVGYDSSGTGPSGSGISHIMKKSKKTASGSDHDGTSMSKRANTGNQ